MGLYEYLADVAGVKKDLKGVIDSAKEELGRDFVNWAKRNVNPKLPKGYQINSCQVSDGLDAPDRGGSIVFNVRVSHPHYCPGYPEDFDEAMDFLSSHAEEIDVCKEVFRETFPSYKPDVPKGVRIRTAVQL